jgi:hypothetical protein
VSLALALSGVLAVLALALPGLAASRDTDPAFTHRKDIVYGRRNGIALTLEMLMPRPSPNGAAVIYLISGAWKSSVH